jgi:hypothetical protein
VGGGGRGPGGGVYKPNGNIINFKNQDQLIQVEL